MKNRTDEVFVQTGLLQEYVETTGAVLGGRNGLGEAAGGKNLEVHSPTIGRQLFERGLIDEIDLHLAPVLLGDGIRWFDSPGGQPVRLHQSGVDDPVAVVNVGTDP